jgi:hypothetical protein
MTMHFSKFGFIRLLFLILLKLDLINGVELSIIFMSYFSTRSILGVEDIGLEVKINFWTTLRLINGVKIFLGQNVTRAHVWLGYKLTRVFYVQVFGEGSHHTLA